MEQTDDSEQWTIDCVTPNFFGYAWPSFSDLQKLCSLSTDITACIIILYKAN